MKKNALILGFSIAISLFSCGNSPAAVKMSDELCETMEKINSGDPMSKYDAASDVGIIRKKKEYSEVTENQLKKVMTQKCPEGWKKYLSIKDK